MPVVGTEAQGQKHFSFDQQIKTLIRPRYEAVDLFRSGIDTAIVSTITQTIILCGTNTTGEAYFATVNSSAFALNIFFVFFAL